MNIFGCPCNGAVDALTRKQNQTLDIVSFAKGQQRRTSICVVWQIDKFVERSCEVSGMNGSVAHYCIWYSVEIPIAILWRMVQNGQVYISTQPANFAV